LNNEKAPWRTLAQPAQSVVTYAHYTEGKSFVSNFMMSPLLARQLGAEYTGRIDTLYHAYRAWCDPHSQNLRQACEDLWQASSSNELPEFKDDTGARPI